MGLDAIDAATQRRMAPGMESGRQVPADRPRTALPGRIVRTAPSVQPRRADASRSAWHRVVDTLRQLPGRAASALRQVARRAWAFPRHLATPARTDRFVLRRHVDHQLAALEALVAMAQDAPAAEQQRLVDEFLAATRVVDADMRRVDAHQLRPGDPDARAVCQARLVVRLADEPLPSLLALLWALDERTDQRPAPEQADSARASLQPVRNVLNLLCYERIVGDGLDATTMAWEEFRRDFAGRHEAAAMDCGKLSGALAAATATNQVLARYSLATPPGRDPNQCLDVVRAGLLAVDADQLAGVLAHASAEVLASLANLFMDARSDERAVRLQELLRQEIDRHPRRELELLASGCADMARRLRRAGAAPLRDPDGRRASDPPALAEPLHPVDALLAFHRHVALLDGVAHHCETCHLPLPADHAELREQLRDQLKALLSQPQLLVANATASPLAQLRRLSHTLRVPDDQGVLTARAQELLAQSADTLAAALAPLGAALAAHPADAARALRAAHLAATARCDLDDLCATLGHVGEDPAGAVLARFIGGLDDDTTAGALASLAAPDSAAVLDPAALHAAAIDDAAPTGDQGRLLRATARLLGEVRTRLRERAAPDTDPVVVPGAPSPQALHAFRELFGFDVPTAPTVDITLSGIFADSFIAPFTGKLEGGMGDSEVRTLAIEGVTMPSQFHADAKRADKATGMGVQFFLSDGQRLVDLDRSRGPLSDDDVDHRVREGFDRLVALYDGNIDRARAAAALANQGFTAAFLQGMLDCASPDNPFQANGVTGTLNHEGDFRAARMAVNIVFDKTADGRPLLHIDYCLHGGRIDDLDGNSVMLDPGRSRVHMRCSAVLEEAAAAGPGLALDGRIAARGRLRVVTPPQYSIRLAPRAYQRPYPEPHRVLDLRPLRMHPDAVDGRETPDQALQRNGMNRQLSQARDELLAIAHSTEGELARAHRLSAKAEALYALWALPPVAGAAAVERALVALERARGIDDALPDAELLAPLKERVAASRLGVAAAFDDASAAVDVRLEEAYLAWRGQGESSTGSAPPHDHATLRADFEAGRPGAAGTMTAFRAWVEARRPDVLVLRRELDLLRAVPSFDKARMLMRRPEFAAFDPQGGLRQRAQRLLERIDAPDIDVSVLAGFEAPLADALEPALRAMVENVRRQPSFSPT